MKKPKSKDHRDKFTGIFDKNGVPIMNGDKINVLDDFHMKRGRNAGTVAWKNGNYYCKGTSCEYNIYAWRKKIVVIFSDRPSIYEESTFQEAAEEYGCKASPANHYDVIKAFQEGVRFQQEQELLIKQQQ